MTKEKRARAIEIIEECRWIHLKWARWQESIHRRGLDWTRKVEGGKVGGPAHHRKWVKNYDFVLEVLKS